MVLTRSVAPRVLIALALTAWILFASCSPVATKSQRADALARRIFSPYCPGVLLSECSSTQAAQLRNEIDQRVARGESDNAVLVWVVSNFGEQSVADGSVMAPLVWGIPLLAIAIASGVVIRKLLRSTAATNNKKGET